MNQPENDTNPEEPQTGAGYSRREVLRLIGAAGGAAGLDRLMPPNWLAPQAAALESFSAPAVPMPIGLQIENLSFVWGTDPYDRLNRIDGTGFFCDGNASFDFRAFGVEVSAATIVQMNTTNLGVLYNQSIASISASEITYADPDNASGTIMLPLPTALVSAATTDMMSVRARVNGSASNTLVQEFFPACGQTTIANLDAVPTDGCLISDPPNFSCYNTISFAYAPLPTIDSLSHVRLEFNGQTLIDWATLDSLGAIQHGGTISFSTLLPAGQAGTLSLTMRNTYGFDTNTLTIHHSTVACAPGLSPELYNSGASPYNGMVTVDFDFHDFFGHISNTSLVTAWLGGQNSSSGPLLLNRAPLAGPKAMGGAFVNNFTGIKWAPSNCSTVVLNSVYGYGNFEVELPTTNVNARSAAAENMTLSFFIAPVNGTGVSNIVELFFDPAAVSLADFSAGPAAGGLAGALGAASLTAASLWAKFRRSDD